MSTIDLVEFDIEVPVDGFFLLDNSVLSGPDLLAPQDGTALRWEPNLCTATSLNVTRGGTRGDVSTSIDVGTVTASFKDDPNPLTGSLIKPNSRVRVRRQDIYASGANAAADVDNWTAAGLNEASVFADETYGAIVLRVESDGPAIEPYTNVALREIDGLTPGTTYTITAQSWGDQLALGVAGFDGAGLPASLPSDQWPYPWWDISFTFTADSTTHTLIVGNTTEWTGPGYIRVDEMVRNIRVRQTDGGVLFTGNVSRLGVRSDKRTGSAYISLTGVDAVKTLANTMRYGAANANAEFEPWYRRAERVLQSSPVPFVVPERPEAGTGTFLHGPDAEAPLWDQAWSNGTGPNGEIILTPSATGNYVRTLTGLTPNSVYNVQLLAVGTGAFSFGGVPATALSGGWTEVIFNFISTSTSHDLTLTTLPGGSVPGLMSLSLYAWPESSPFNAANVVYESNLVNHLDLAANTGNSGWYVDRFGVVRFRENSEVIAHFSDVHDQDDPLHVCYTDIDAAFDTAEVVNDLTLSNHARIYDASQSTWRADDKNLGPFVDLASQATWGVVGAKVETSIYSPATGLYAGSAARLAAQLMAGRSAPAVTISSVTFNGADAEDIATSVDIYSRITVTSGSVTQTCRVISISHDIQPNKWLVTLNLESE
jgi:hypothetical protein